MPHCSRSTIVAAFFSLLSLCAVAQAKETISSPTVVVSGASYNIGDTVTVTVSFTHTPTGSGSVINNALDITLALPSGLSATGSPTCSKSPTSYSDSSGTISCANTGWTGIDLNPTDSSIQTYTLTVSANIQSEGAFDVQGSLTNIKTSSVTTPNPVAATDNTIVPVDLSLSLAASPASNIALGTDVTFTGTISNAGNRNATGVDWQAVLPVGYVLKSGFSLSGSGLTVNAASGGTAGTTTFSFVATAQAATSLTSYEVTAQITAQTEPDVDSTANNSDNTEDDYGSVTAAATQLVDLDLAFSAPTSAPSVNVGASQSYTLTLANNGPSVLADGDFVLYVPQGYTIANAGGATQTANSGECKHGTANCNTLTWAGLNLNANASLNKTVTLTPKAGTGNPNDFDLIAEVTAVNDANGLTWTSAETPNNYSSSSPTGENDEDELGLQLADVDVALKVNNGTLNPYTGTTIPVEMALGNSGVRNTGQIKVCLTYGNGVENVDISGASGLATGVAGCSGVVWTVSDVPTGTSSTTGNVKVTLHVDVAATGNYSLTAEVIAEAAPDTDSVPNNNVASEDDQDTVTLTPVQNADLSLAMSVDNPTPVVGEVIQFTVTLSNAGPNDVTGVTVVDTVPNGFNSIANISNGGSASGSNISWSGLSVTAGASLDLTFKVKVLGGGSSYLNVAEITASGLDDLDSTPNNGLDTEDDYAKLNVPPPLVDLEVTAEGVPSPSPAIAGSSFSYAFRLANISSIGAPGSTVTDLPPLYQNAGDAGLQASSMSYTCEAFNGACCVAGGSASQCGASPNPVNVSGSALSAYAVDLPPNSHLIFRATGTVDPRSATGATATLSNQVSAQVASGSTENITSNNTNIDVLQNTTVAAESDLSISKTLQSIQCPPAQLKAQVAGCAYNFMQVVYEIAVTNQGPSRVSNATVSDALNSQEFSDQNGFNHSWTCSITTGNTSENSCTASGTGDLNDTALTLLPGAAATYVFTAFTSTNTGRVHNTATVTVPAGVTDPNPSNNSDTEVVGLSGQADLSVSMSAPATVIAGEQISWSMLISNTPASDDALGARVTDLFPPQVENVQWSCSAVTPIPGDLNEIALETSPDLVTPSALLFTTLGDQVYVLSQDGNAILAYRREVVQGSLFGSLTLIDTEKQNVNSDNGQAVDGMVQPVALALSPDQRFVYVVSVGDVNTSAALTWFTRDSNPLSSQYGKLTFAGTTALSNTPGAVLVSPDGEQVYVSSAAGVSLFDRNAALGSPGNERTAFGSGVTGKGANSMAFVSGGNALLLSDSSGTELFQRDGNSGSSTFGLLTASLSSVAGNQHSLGVHPEENWILLASGTNVQAYPLNTDTNSIGNTPVSLSVSNNASAAITVDGLTISPDGEHVLVWGNGFAGYYRFDVTTGTLTKETEFSDGHGNRVSGFSPDGRHLLIGYADGLSGIRVFDRKAPDPILTFLEQDRQGDAAGSGSIDGLTGATAMALRSDGQWLYATGIAGQGSLVWFQRNENKGKDPATAGEHLTYFGSLQGGANGVPSMRDVFDIEQLNDYLYLASQTDNSILIFSVTATGSPLYVGQISDAVNLAGVTGLVADPARNMLYATSLYGDAVIAFSADPNTGALTQTQVIRDSDAGISGLDGAFQLALAPDSATGAPGHLLVTSSIADQLVVFSRDVSGALNYETSLANVGDRPLTVAVAPDGRHVYVGAANSHSIAVLQRVADGNRSDYGSLALLGQYVNGLGGVSGIRGIRSLALSPDGRRLYAAAEVDGSLVVFDRNDEPSSAEFGQLTQVLRHEDNINGVDGLEQVYQVMVSFDGRFVYTAALADNAVDSFSQGTGSRCPASGTGNLNGLLVDVAAGGNLRFEVTADVLPSATVGTLVNTMTVADPDGFTDATPTVSASQSTNLDIRVDLQISKTDGRVSATAGESLTYDIVVRNQGPSDAIHMAPENVLLRDVLDTSLFDSTQASWTCEAVGSGRLTLKDVEYDGLNQADGLAGASSVAIAPPLNGSGGTYVYATGLLENALSVFQLDTATGALSFVQVVRADSNNPLLGASDVTVSADGQFVLVTAQISDAVTVYQATETSGYALNRLDSKSRSDANGLDQAVAISKVASNGDVFVAGARNHSLVQLNFDGTALSVVASYQNNAGGVSHMQGPVDVLLNQAEDRVVVAASASNALVFFSRDTGTGALAYQRSVVDGATLGSDTVSGLAGVQAVSESVQGTQSYVYAVGRDADAVVVLTMTDGMGISQWIQKLEQGTDLSNFDGPVRMAISPDSLHLYVAASNSASLSQFGIGADGTLRLQQQLLASDGLPALTQPNGLAFSPSGLQLASVSGDSNALALYARKADTLCPDSGGNAALAAGIPVTVANGGEIRLRLQVPVKSDVSSAVVNTATIDIGNNGKDSEPATNSATDSDQLDQRADLTIQKWDEFNQYDGLRGVRDVVVSADGNYFYTAGRSDNALGAWDNSGSEPVFIQALRNNSTGNSGFNGVNALALSPDNAHLYAVSDLDNALLVLRVESDGTLTQLQDLRDDGTIQGLGGANDVVVSPDGEHVYVLGRTLGAVVVFARDSMSGQLTYQSILRNAVNGVQDMSLPDALAISADGAQLYVTSQASNALVVLGRENDSQATGYGDLTYLASYISGINGVTDMNGPLAVLPDAGNQYVYVSAADSRAIVWFQRQTDGSLQFAGSLTAQSAGTAVEFDDLRALAMDAAGTALYALSDSGNAINRLQRNGADGSLQPESLAREGDATSTPTVFVSGLRGGRALALDATNGKLWVAAEQSSAISRWSTGGSVDTAWETALVDEGGGAAPGSSVTYHILVRNQGPASVTGARVQDVFPLAFTTISWVCQQDNSVCTPSGNGDLDTLVNLAPGAQVEFVATANLSTEARGMVVNTATVTAPAGVLDPDASNNQASDENTVLIPAVDVSVMVDNGQTSLESGQSVTYTMMLSNAGPSHAENVTASLVMPEGTGFSNWSCSATPLPGLLQDANLPANDLDPVRAMVMSPDQNDLYVVGQAGGADVLAHYRRDLRTGELVQLTLISNNSVFGGQNISNLDGISDVVISPDGLHVYVAAPDADTITLFQRNPVDGSLNLAGSWIDQVGGVDGLAGVHALALSADGSRLYALAALDDSITRFDIAATGQLSWQQTLFSGAEPDVQQPLSLAVAKNGRDVYLLTGANRLVTLRHDAFGDLSVLSSQNLTGLAGFGSPLQIRLVRDDAVLLLLGAANNGSLVSYLRNAAGSLVLNDNLPLNLTNAPASMLPLEQGQQVLIAGGGEISIWEGSQTGYSRIASLNDTVSASVMLANASEQVVYLGNSNLQLVNRLQGSRCSAFGYGSIRDQVSLAAGGTAIYTLNTSVSASYVGPLSVVGEARVNLPALEQNPLDNVAVDSDNVGNTPTLAGTLDIDNTLVAGLDASYTLTVENTGNADAMNETLSVLLPWQPVEVDGFDPQQTVLQCSGSAPLQWQQLDADARLAHVDQVLASPDGNHLYALDGSNGHLFSWSINAGVPQALAQLDENQTSNGLLLEGLQGATRMQLSPTGDTLYVLATSSNRILVFARDLTSGALQLIQRMENAPDQAVNLLAPRDLVVTPDGMHAYVASSGADTISRFDRDPHSGVLTWAGQQRDGFDSVFPESNVLRGVNGLALADEGRVLYATASDSDAISAFLVDAVTGELNYQQVVRNNASVNTTTGTQALRGLSTPAGLRTTLQGRFLYLQALGSGNLFVFAKSATSTDLTLVQTLEPGVGDLPAYSGPLSMTFSDDASRVYLNAAGSGQLLVLRRSVVDGSLQLLQTMTDADSADPHLSAVLDMVQMPNTENLLLAGDMAGLQRWHEQGFANCSALLSGSAAASQTVELESGARLLLNLDAGQLPPQRRSDVVASLSVDDANNANLLTVNRTDTPEVHTDLVVTLQQSGGRTVAGESLQVTATVSNGGPSSLLDGSLELAQSGSWTETDWSCSDDTVASCDLGSGTGAMGRQNITLPPGSQLTFVFNGDLDSGFINQNLNITATGITEAGAMENDPADDVASLDLMITGEADLALTGSVDSTWIPGSSTQIVLNLVNNGPSDSNDSLLDVFNLPTQLQVNNASCTPSAGAACPFAGNNLSSLTAFSLPVGTSIQIVIDGSLASSLTQANVNLEVHALQDQTPADDVTDPDSSNNGINVPVLIQPTGDLSILGMADSEDPYDTFANNNQPLVYTIDWSMDGPSDAVNPEVLLTVTTGLSLQTTPGCVQNGSQVACALPDTVAANLPVSGTLTLPFDASGLTVGQGRAQAEIQALQVDAYPADNTAEETTQFESSVDLETYLTQAPAFLIPGDQFQLVLEVENHGSAVVDTFSLQVDLDQSLLQGGLQLDLSSCVGCSQVSSNPLIIQGPIDGLQRKTVRIDASLDANLDVSIHGQLDITGSADVVTGLADKDSSNNTVQRSLTISDTRFEDGFEGP